MTKGWKVTLVHGPDDVDEETLTTLHSAVRWASLRGMEYHREDADCLELMKKRFYPDSPEYPTYIQYGTDYHWVTFEKVA